ncbi:unnamed protein product, partial [Rotaria sp. Silwood2]
MTKILSIAGTITYASYDLLTCYLKSLSSGEYSTYYHYDQTFDLKCTLNLIISMINKDVRIQLNAIERLPPSLNKIQRAVDFWKIIKENNPIYSNILNLINNFSGSSTFNDFTSE